MDVAEVDGHEALARGKAEETDQRRVRVQDLTRERGAEEAHGHALEERAVTRLGLARDAPPRGLLERGADRRDEARKVVRVLEDVVVEPRLHGRDGQLLAARARAEEDRQVGVALPHRREELEGVDPSGPVVGDDDVAARRVEAAGQLRRLGEQRDPAPRQSGGERVAEHLAIAGALVHDEDSQRFAGPTARERRASAGHRIGWHQLSVSGSVLCHGGGRSRRWTFVGRPGCALDHIAGRLPRPTTWSYDEGPRRNPVPHPRNGQCAPPQRAEFASSASTDHERDSRAAFSV